LLSSTVERASCAILEGRKTGFILVTVRDPDGAPRWADDDDDHPEGGGKRMRAQPIESTLAGLVSLRRGPDRYWWTGGRPDEVGGTER
jgi:hypothetical protein